MRTNRGKLGVLLVAALAVMLTLMSCTLAQFSTGSGGTQKATADLQTAIAVIQTATAQQSATAPSIVLISGRPADDELAVPKPCRTTTTSVPIPMLNTSPASTYAASSCCGRRVESIAITATVLVGRTMAVRASTNASGLTTGRATDRPSGRRGRQVG